VYSRLFRAHPQGRNGRYPVEVTRFMLRLRRRDARKVEKLAAVLAALAR
jgi:hypothetical protein